MNIKQQYRSFKAWQINAFDWSYDENEYHYCVNCGNDFAGNFCPYCSQKAELKKISWKSVMKSTAEVWGMHNRSMLYSLLQLVFRPGYLISDYINGRRQVSFPPVKMLVIMGVISVIIDQLFKDHYSSREVLGMIEENSPIIDRYLSWLKLNPGWGWLSVTSYFIFPTWCLFRYSPCNTKHSLPQGFFIQVLMSIMVLIVDDLADLFTGFFYILVPLCYFYSYRQLFGYGFWGNFWRVMMMLFSGFMFAFLIWTITELFIKGLARASVDSLVNVAMLVLFSVVPILVGMYISKISFKRREKKKEAQNLEISDSDKTETNNKTQ